MKNLPVKENIQGKPLGSMSMGQFVSNKVTLSAVEGRDMQTPAQTVMKNFLGNKRGIIGILGFCAILAFSFIGAQLFPVSLNYRETLLRNLRPGTNYLDFPGELEREGVLQIDSGVSFSVALSKAGNIYVWGQQPVQIIENMSTSIFHLPQELLSAQVQHIAAGDRHALAITVDGHLYGWGNNNYNQAIPRDSINFDGRQVVQLAASNFYSAILFDDGTLTVWGSAVPAQMRTVSEEIQGRITKIIPQPQNILMLLVDGTVDVIGTTGGALAKIPERLQDGSVNVVDITASNLAALALDDKGQLHIWGSQEHGLQDMPKYQGIPVALIGGHNNMGFLLDSGEVVYWGSDHIGQLAQPEEMQTAKIVRVFGSYFQNYGIAEDGKIHAWGNKGFCCGSDEFGRDLFTRLIHGGKISLTVGAMAVLISVILALAIGMPAGFLGGWVDQVLMAVTDFVRTIPVLPIAITLSVIVAGRVPDMYRVYMLMVIIGILGWPHLARLVRTQILLEREKDYVLAARALGIRHSNIIIRHVLPNVFSVVLINAIFGYANAILLEAAYSFLGFGIQDPTPSWGNMLQKAQSSLVLDYFWWRWVITGLLILLAALSINLVGKALQDAMNPKANEI